MGGVPGCRKPIRPILPAAAPQRRGVTARLTAITTASPISRLGTQWRKAGGSLAERRGQVSQIPRAAARVSPRHRERSRGPAAGAKVVIRDIAVLGSGDCDSSWRASLRTMPYVKKRFLHPMDGL